MAPTPWQTPSSSWLQFQLYLKLCPIFRLLCDLSLLLSLPKSFLRSLNFYAFFTFVNEVPYDLLMKSLHRLFYSPEVWARDLPTFVCLLPLSKQDRKTNYPMGTFTCWDRNFSAGRSNVQAQICVPFQTILLPATQVGSSSHVRIYK